PYIGNVFLLVDTSNNAGV
ncbi:unnamed protein product, partial [Rotaria magnacalcarata]